MKTNTKRAINIILSLAMMISLVTTLGGVALAAPVLSNASAAIVGEEITVRVTLEGVEGSTYASLRAMDRDDETGAIVFLDQYVLKAGLNDDVKFAIDAVELKGKVLKIVIAAGAGAGTAEVFLPIFVSKDALKAAIEAAELKVESVYSARSWAVFAPALVAAVKVFEEPLASQAQVDAACKALVDATDGLELLMTKLKINAAATYSVKRNESYTFEIIVNDGAYVGDLVWAVSNELYAEVEGDGLTAEVTIFNKTGTVILSVTDRLTKLSNTIVLRIT